MFCINCGSQNRDNSKFCAVCGASLSAPTSRQTNPKQASFPTPGSTIPTAVENSPINRVAAAAVTSGRQTATAAKKKPPMLLIPVLAVVVAVIVIGFVSKASYHVASVSYYRNGELSFILTYTYDSDWNMVTSTHETEYGSNTTTYTYDSDGKVLMAVSENFTFTYTYDSDGNLLMIATDGYTFTYTYDSDGNVVSVIESNQYGSSGTTTYTYDSKGRETAEVTEYSNGDTLIYDTYTYDRHGNLLKKSGEDSDGNTYAYVYTYYS